MKNRKQISSLMESLEDRRLMYVSVDMWNNLTITGTAVHDHIRLSIEAVPPSPFINNNLNLAELVVRENGVKTFSSIFVMRSITINAGGGGDYVHIGPGVRGVSIDLGDGFDTAFGGDGDDWITGGIGRNSITGGGGNDNLSGGDELDLIRGGAGNDRISGGAGNDNLFGESGDDFVSGGKDDDFVYGGDGDDELHGDDGNDVLRGENGNDLIYGEAGADGLVGGLGDDYLHGGVDFDVDNLFGGDGYDSFVVYHRPTQLIDTTPDRMLSENIQIFV